MKALGRFIIAWLLTLPWAMVVLIFKLQAQPNPYVQLFFASTIPLFLIGFSFYYLADLVNIKLGLLTTSETKGMTEDYEKSNEKESNEEESSALLQDSQNE